MEMGPIACGSRWKDGQLIDACCWLSLWLLHGFSTSTLLYCTVRVYSPALTSHRCCAPRAERLFVLTNGANQMETLPFGFLASCGRLLIPARSTESQHQHGVPGTEVRPRYECAAHGGCSVPCFLPLTQFRFSFSISTRERKRGAPFVFASLCSVAALRLAQHYTYTPTYHPGPVPVFGTGYPGIPG